MDGKEPSTPLVLLGAGASVPAGIPTALGMTVKMMELCRVDRHPAYLRALMAITGALQMGVGQNEPELATWDALEIPEYPDIERVMNAALLLGDRLNLEFAPFVGAWHPIIEELERRNLRLSDIQHIAGNAAGHISLPILASDHALRDWVRTTLREVLEHALGALAIHLSRRPDGGLFRGLAAYLTRKLINLTWLRTPDTLVDWH
jgi:hypothetical protein